MRVLIADDHQIIREGVKRVLEDCSDITAVGEASSAEEALQALAEKPWDVVVLDIKLPRRSGLEVLRDIKVMYPHLPVLMLSMYPEAQFAYRTIRSGASGYLTKGIATEEIVRAIRCVAAGRRYVSRALADRLAEDALPPARRSPHDALTNREFDILRLLASGKTVSEIAADSGVSTSTVSSHRSHILEKLSLRKTTDLVRYAIEHGLLE
jgi:two-component system invasion response regulator UvrY